MKRIAAFALIGVMSLSVFVGCTKTQPEEKKPEDSVVTQPADDQETPDPSETQQQEDQDVKKVEGIYTGQIDGNSIEVQVGREPMVFWMEDISKAINGLKGKEKVRIEYKEAESGQLRLIKIEKLQ
ncbi:hypothetical protein HNQ80_003375 [Anaerosolibacter carboniphilus]|uniref:Membrane-bound protein LytA n=1 Tax=Anaerosolibacter carboniphilus TaxID=1417629 RepID=A0A841KUF7_9FIRM|nr:hypothetical protein [Anaerosolibacter carboniphilus]MBB6217256.1 hypothetical protein [Anaerosolibacter carboniphilus]